jgi:crotonobetainyl-CoA:carnitine CoA-transferase CaiB-like acyl-CoA transferase
VRALRSAVEPAGEAPTGAVPALGQHTDAVLAELGFTLADLDRMRAEATIG